MHIIFNSIEMRNFMSIGNGYIDLNNQGYVLINGINNNPLDQAKSNGSGKSSAINAVVYALTGQTLSGIKNVVNKYSNDGCKVTLKFSLDNVNYQIDRYKDDSKLGTNLKFFVNGEDKSGKGIRDTEKIIAEYFPDLTDSFIGSVIILGQGLPQRFTNNTPAGRKEVLETLSKSDFMIQDIKEKLSNRRIELNNNLRCLEDAILSDESKKSVVESQLAELLSDKALLTPVDFDSDIAHYEKIIAEAKYDRDDKTSQKSKINTDIDNMMDKYREITSHINSSYISECTRLDECYHVDDMKKDLAELESTIRVKNEQILKLDSIKDVCPTCGQHLPDVHKVDTTEYKAELNTLKNSLYTKKEEFSNLLSDIELKKKAFLDNLNNDSDAINKELNNLKCQRDLIDKDIHKLDSDVNSLQLSLDKVRLNKDTYEKRIKTIDEDIAKAKESKSQYEQKILYNNIEKDNIEKHIDVINKMITLATRDFRGFLLSEVISYIDKKAKEYALDIFNNDNIAFALDGNNISITYLDKEYESLSGGEKQKVDLIIQFSIRDMLTQFMNFSCNMIALDEVFDGLDSIGCQNVINMIAKRLSDIESVFIITHHASELDIPYDKQLFVVKDERGISEIK